MHCIQAPLKHERASKSLAVSEVLVSFEIKKLLLFSKNAKKKDEVSCQSEKPTVIPTQMNCQFFSKYSPSSPTTFYLTALILIVIPFSQMAAENILLRKGGIVKGKVVDQDQSKLTIQKEDGSRISIAKDEILKVVYKEHISAEEEEKLRKADEAKAKALAEKERLQKEKAEAEAAEKERLASEKDLKAKQELEAKNREAKQKEQEEWQKQQASIGNSLTVREAVLSSALLPGWGQYKQDRKLAAYIYPSLLALGLYFTYDSHRLYLNAKRDYNNLNNPYSETGLLQAALGVPSQATTGAPLDPVSALVANEVSPFEGQREAVEGHFRQTQSLGALTLGIYVLQLCDVLIFHPSPNKNRVTSLSPDADSKERVIFKTQQERLDLTPISVPGTAFSETKTRLGFEIRF